MSSTPEPYRDGFREWLEGVEREEQRKAFEAHFAWVGRIRQWFSTLFGACLAW